jgi:uncharacterized protein
MDTQEHVLRGESAPKDPLHREDIRERRMTNPLRLRSWNPYLVGVGIGVLSWIAFATAAHPIGVTTAFEHTAALIIGGLGAGWPSDGYFADHSPKIGWEWTLVMGVFLGSFLSARLGDDRTKTSVPRLWAIRFGESRAKRFAAAFLGAALMLFGARLASGCTSGHGISGNLQLALSSLVFTAAFGLVGIVTALWMYRRKGARHV